jgi:hypothetical protein
MWGGGRSGDKDGAGKNEEIRTSIVIREKGKKPDEIMIDKPRLNLELHRDIAGLCMNVFQIKTR